MFKKILLFFLLNIFVVSASVAGNGFGRQNSNTGTDTGFLSTVEIEGLLYMREEEKLARDVYLKLYEEWNNPVFSNIAEAEQKHTDAILKLIEIYRLIDPALQETGLFVNAELQELYDSLIDRGMTSATEALMTGALIEEVDMVDILEVINQTQQEDIISVYENLLCGSRNHLRAFVGQIEKLGIVYQAQVLTQDEVDAIVDSAMERTCGR